MSKTYLIRNSETGKFLTSEAFDAYERGESRNGIENWTDDVNDAAWLHPVTDSIPAGLDGECELVDLP